MKWFAQTALILLITFSCLPAHAGGLIRDAEIEATLRDYADPIFKAAGLKPSAIHIYIVQDDSLNAFVAGGQNLFIHTGLIMEMKDPSMLMGVMAHETGHISGGHLAKGAEKLKDAQLGTILSAVLGAAAAAATGRPEAAAAVITGTSGAVMRNVLSFSRANENAADQAGMGFLDKLGISASGMTEVFALLKRQERQRLGSPDPYLLTHPLSSERIENVKSHVGRSAIPQGTYPKSLDEKHARMVAKLYAFLNVPEKTLQRYPAGNNSVANQMARAIAFFMQAKVDQATAIMDALIKERPNDAYLYDLKGQILFESARIDDAYDAYRTANKLAPNESLILVELAKAELALGTPADITQAQQHLERSLALDRDSPGAWHLLAIAHGKQGNEAMSSLALAEEALLAGDADGAIVQAGRALGKLPAKSPSHQRAEDLKQRAQQMKKEQKDAESSF
ncbi:MAG: M48 family metalloprotease [Alphaproteobacteria bacterium]|nr:M48 family metalloprotease [Alphaproteobacteria bacterium]